MDRYWKFRERLQQKIEHLFAAKFRTGSISLGKVIKLNWLRTVFTVTSLEINAVFCAAWLMILLLQVFQPGPSLFPMESFISMSCTLAIAYFGIGFAFVFLMTPFERWLDADQQSAAFWPYFAVAGILTCGLDAYFASLLDQALRDNPSSFLEHFVVWIVLSNVAMLLVLMKLGNWLSFHVYARKHATAKIFEYVPEKYLGELIGLIARQNYVEILTTRGRTEIRMSLGDAIDNCAPIDGTRIHRSYWVADNFYNTPYRKDRRWLMDVPGETFSVSAEKAKSSPTNRKRFSDPLLPFVS